MDILSFLSSSWGLLIGTIVPFLFVLTIVVFFHELGHFLVGRWNGVDVDVFSVGFGPELVGFNDKHGTRWKISAIPLGGYVKFFGDADAASSPDFEKLKEMDDEQKSRSFEGKSVWRRAAVVVAGPAANFILSFIIFAGVFWSSGQFISDPVVVEVRENGPAAKAGFLPGDLITAIDGEEVQAFSDVVKRVAPAANRQLTFTVKRDGSDIALEVTPEKTERKDGFGNLQSIGVIGIISNNSSGNARRVELGFLEACEKSVSEIKFIITQTFQYVHDIFVGRQSAEQLSGPIRIAKISGDVATLGIESLIHLAGVLSVSIGLINLFPIPMLDGGHLVFYAYEAIRGKPLGERALENFYRVGVALVLSLMVFATWNDITQLLR